MGFMEEFRDMCETLEGKLSEDELGFPVCYLEDDAQLVGYPDFNSISLEKKGEIILDVSGFDKVVFPSKYLSPTAFKLKGFGKHIACFKAEDAGICINERGDIVKVLIPEKEE